MTEAWNAAPSSDEDENTASDFTPVEDAAPPAATAPSPSNIPVEPRRPASRVVKTSMTLPQSSVDSIRILADAFGTTMAEAVRRAIATERFLHETTSAGGKILIKEKGRSQMKELLIR